MANFHGVFVDETPTSIVPCIVVDSDVQVGVGMATVNQAKADVNVMVAVIGDT